MRQETKVKALRTSLLKGWADNMGNLLKLEFTKLKKQKSFYICTIIMVALLLLSALTANALMNASPELAEQFTASGISSFVSGLNDSSFTLIASIFVVLFICEDYASQTVKNIYARGYSRKEVYLSKLISALISTTVMFVIVEIAAFTVGTVFFGLGEVGNFKFLALIGTQYVVAMANIALTFAVASVIRKNGGAIAGIILAPMLVGVVTGLADSFLKFEDFSLTSLWLSNFLSDVSVLTVSAERIITCLVGSIIYIPLFVIAGLYYNKKIEL